MLEHPDSRNAQTVIRKDKLSGFKKFPDWAISREDSRKGEPSETTRLTIAH